MKKHSGYVAIIGRPNVGKSTLLNTLVGEKLAGVSPKPQTTRNVIRGILSKPEGQIIFFDTPGHHAPEDLLGSWMLKEIESTLHDANLLYWMVLPQKPHPEEAKILELIKEKSIPVFLLVNQVDRYPKPHVLPVLDYYHKAYGFKEMIPISAKTGDQVDLLIKKSFEVLPEQEPLFPEDQISDQDERFLVMELIREKLYHMTEKEIPYATTVIIEEFKEKSAGLVHIHAAIMVERDSQKSIVIGKGGKMLKKIGQFARLDIQKFLGKRVFLELWVKTVRDWKKDKAALKRLGYH